MFCGHMLLSFDMASVAKEVGNMRSSLGKKFDLEPPAPMDINAYMGCGQDDGVD